MNPVTVRIFYINHHKIENQFFDMRIETPARAIGIFQTVESAKSINESPLENCITLGVENTTVNTGQHNSLIIKLRKQSQNCKLMVALAT